MGFGITNILDESFTIKEVLQCVMLFFTITHAKGFYENYKDVIFFKIRHLYATNYHHFINAKTKMYDFLKIQSVFNNILSQREENETVPLQQEQTTIIPSVLIEKKYEEKYLEKVRSIPNQYIFTKEEQQLEENAFLRLLATTILKLETDKEKTKSLLLMNQQELSDYENMEFNECDKQVTYDSDGEELESYQDQIEDKKRGCAKTIEELKAKLILLNNTVVSEEDIQQQAHKSIVDSRLNGLKNSFIMEKTPLGNVIMLYNHKKEAFEYYSDNTIPYRFLEVIGRKYVLTFNCRPLYVDMDEELTKYEKKIEERKAELVRQEEETLSISDGSQPVSTKKNVFAQFKSYNKEAGNGRVNKAPPPKNSIQNKQQKTNNENVILKERSNHYTCAGRFANFNMLQKIDKKVVDKKYAMSFADFKKTMNKVLKTD